MSPEVKPLGDKADRRRFLKLIGATGTTVAVTTLLADEVSASSGKEKKKDFGSNFGCLIDATQCVGCRSCEETCNIVNELPKPDTSFDDPTVLSTFRRPNERAYTVVNRFNPNPPNVHNQLEPVHVKVQCMHCNDPACVSACIVAAMEKTKEGPVVYHAEKCIGCRYCMVACPFQIPAYEYMNSLTPRVMKCHFCYERYSSQGGWPACARSCPREAIQFGTREELLTLAKTRIRKYPGRYIDHVYGETEVGGTSWMYISSVEFEKIGFIELSEKPIPNLAETLQHNIFKYFLPPLALYSFLAISMFFNKPHTTKEEYEDQVAKSRNKAKEVQK